MTAGVNDRFDFTAPVPPVADLGPVHFIAIGGSGMSGVARMFLAAGVRVSGSDARDSATLRELEAEGARVVVGQRAENLGDDVETVVVSSAIRETNPELAAARERGLRVLHRAQGIAALLHGRSAVAVAGANGKTTTSGMLTVALEHSGAHPAYVLGSPLTTGDGTGTNAAPGTGPFVVEADESDGSFLTYRPDVAVVTNIKPDHLDFYGDFVTIEATFARFAGTIREGGLLVAAADDPGAVALATAHREAGGAVVTFGTGEGADVRLTDLRPDAMTATAQVTWQRDLAPVRGAESGGAAVIPAGTTRTLTVPMPGEHNLANSAAALVAATAGLGQDLDAVLAGLAAYPGTHRRFERVGEACGVRVVDDYAHNPDKVAAVVRAGRGLVDASGGRLAVVFQPHLFTRTRDFAREFAAGLSSADLVVLMDVYAAREDPLDGVTGATIAELVDGPEVHFVADRDAVVPTVAGWVRDGDLVLVVGAGDVTELGAPIVTAIAEGER
ncbi:UDP-N-acetylmuramate--L-alanine ligase [Ornithinimicrobium sp. F0845]|uniref:UDP-N-acetylmuramate--L-alanine ligase n=1 Tax=Ornithinimicrobium sp. F0845 TaxID=2926412 RepID=UPI001FF55637|nr:UDP-N-acetylmuramate--L-alanine ligase [Ornithinimicrobium sp. F0845]MCK0112669.1 UDP-N-acetylmuramate--L-alanine ligase [Ornithinimicrobium sp. F0845]